PSRLSTIAHRAREDGPRMRESLQARLALTEEGRPPRGPLSTCPVPHVAVAPMRMRSLPAVLAAPVRDAVTAPNGLASPTSSSLGGTKRIRLTGRDVKLGECAVRCQGRAPCRRQLLRRLM